MKGKRVGSSGSEKVRTDDFGQREAGAEPASASDVSVGTGGRSVRNLLERLQLRNVGLLVVTIALFLAGFETAMRVFAPQSHRQPIGRFIPHPVRRVDLRPHSVIQGSTSEYSARYVTNEYGWKDYEIKPKTPATFRILCVGDSFTMGVGTSIEEAYPKVLQSILRKELRDDSIEVINVGGFGYAVPHHLSRMRELGFGLEPDVVILQLYPENDISDSLAFVGKALESSSVAWLRHSDKQHEQLTALSHIRNSLRRHSHAFVFLYDRWEIVKDKYGWFQKETKHYPTIPGRPFYLETSLKKYYPALEEGWQLNETYIREFRDECRKRGVPLLAFEVPAKFELGETMRQPLVEDAGANPELYDFSKNWRMTNEMLERLDIPYADVRTLFLATGHPEDYYWKRDVHTNSQGNALIAEALRPFAVKQYHIWADGRSEEQ